MSNPASAYHASLSQNIPHNENTDKTNWLGQLLKDSPTIREARDLVNPIERAKKFAQLYLPENRLIPHDVLLSLIFQHLNSLGLTYVQSQMQHEWANNIEAPSNRVFSQLSLLLERGLRKSENFWELTLNSDHSPKTSKIAKKLLDEEVSKVIGVNTAPDTDDSPIDKEKPFDPNFIKFKDGEKMPSEASLNQLIYFCTSSKTADCRAEVAQILCMNISTYSTPKLFFKKLRDRFKQLLDEKKNANEKHQSEEAIENFESRTAFLNLLKGWFSSVADRLEPQIVEMVYDFQNKQLSQVEDLPNISLRPKASQANTSSNVKPPRVELGKIKGLFTRNFDIFDLPEIEFARQLTIYTSTLYYSVKDEEFLDAAWDSNLLKYRAPNLVQLGYHFTAFSSWIQYQILSEKDKDKRWNKSNYMLNVADHLFKMNNYMDGPAIIFAFLDALNPYYEFKSKGIDTNDDIRLRYQNICDNNPELIKCANDALKKSLPVVPFIPSMLPGISSYINATPAYLPEDKPAEQPTNDSKSGQKDKKSSNQPVRDYKLINFSKCKRIYDLISDFRKYATYKYDFTTIDQIQDMIAQMYEFDKNLIYTLSDEVITDEGINI